MADKRQALAIFDLDGTLIRGDSLLPFVIFVGKSTRRWKALSLLPVDLSSYAVGLRSDRSAKERILTRFLHGLSQKELKVLVDAFLEAWLPGRLIDASKERLRHHQSEGHRVILLSASPDVYVPQIAKRLGIEEVICTQIIWENETCLGKIKGDNCKGEAKLRMLREYLQRSEAPDESFGYGDQKSDLPVLTWVKEGYLLEKNQFVCARME